MKMNSLRKHFMIGALMIAATASAVETPPQPENLARGKLCKSFSSMEECGWSLVKLTDGETGTVGWSSKAFSAYPDHTLYPEFVVLDIGASARIFKVVLHPRADDAHAGKGFPKDFSIHVCQEGEPWREIIRKKDYPEPRDGSMQEFLFEGITARYLKIEATGLPIVDGEKHYFQLSELEVFGRRISGKIFQPIAAPVGTPAVIRRLRCENRDNPVGIDTPNPRFSWWMESPRRGDRQTSYRILVASSEQLLEADTGDLWESGTVKSDQSIAIGYAGRPLASGKAYWWKVQLTDRNGEVVAWSEPASFVMGKMEANSWQGQWIGANSDTHHGAVYLRNEIRAEKPVKRAIVHFCGLGLSELYIEGRKVGDHVITPGFTTYDKRTQYLTYDVTNHFSKTGSKTLAIILADGWYGLGKDPWVHGFQRNRYVDKPKLLLDLHLEHTDGTETVITSGEGWKWSPGEITFSWIAQEDIDMRKAHPGWDKTGFDDSAWSPVKVVKGPGGTLVQQKEPPCCVVEEIKPMTMIYDEKTRSCTYDFGREFCGWVRFRTSGDAGTVIMITAVPRGGKYTRTSRFVLAGTGEHESYAPRFWYNSIHRVVIEGLQQPPRLEDMTGCMVSSGWQRGGNFRCSNDLVNWLYNTAGRTSVAYTTFLPNDCSREWKAWTQDPQNMFVSNCYLYDSQTLYERWQWDIIDGQRADGNCPNIAPGAFFDDYNSPWWGGCVVWLPWHWYLYFGDSTLLKDSYPAMKMYVDYLDKVAVNGLQDWGLDDWQPVDKTPRAIINTPAFCLYAEIVSRTAEMTGQTLEAKHYAERARRIRDKFNRRFLDPGSGRYGATCTQAGQVVPLALGLVPEELQPAVENSLLQEVIAKDTHLSTGFVSTPYLLQVMMDLAPELGWKITTARDYPSYYSMTAGSDNELMKEDWQGGQVIMPSLGGNIAGWFYQSLGGIRPDKTGPGFKRIIIKPNIIGDLHWASCSYNSVHGLIKSTWRTGDGQLSMDISIPANTTATVYVPAGAITDVNESGLPLGKAPGVTFLRMENGRAVLRTVSGCYSFISRNY